VYIVPWKYRIPRERTKKEQNYYKLGEKGEIKEDNGKHHITITKGTNYQQRFFYINGGMEHNVVGYV
jgi:hypothetical protein